MNPADDFQAETFATAEMPLLYKVSSVMALLQVSHATVYRLVASGELTLVKLSPRASRITSESVRTLMRKYEASPTPIRAPRYTQVARTSHLA
jgi:predicted DNA-binding transcriptional regulator AlpA